MIGVWCLYGLGVEEGEGLQLGDEIGGGGAEEEHNEEDDVAHPHLQHPVGPPPQAKHTLGSFFHVV